MILHVDLDHHTFGHRCDHCGATTVGRRIDPAHGHLIVTPDTAHGPANLVIPCADCLGLQGAVCGACHQAHGGTWECIPFDHLSAIDTGDAPHPASMVGHVFPDTGFVVSEHIVAGATNPARVQQARHILALQRHPAIVAARAKANTAH